MTHLSLCDPEQNTATVEVQFIVVMHEFSDSTGFKAKEQKSKGGWPGAPRDLGMVIFLTTG
jgi:hypothetical protein